MRDGIHSCGNHELSLKGASEIILVTQLMCDSSLVCERGSRRAVVPMAQLLQYKVNRWPRECVEGQLKTVRRQNLPRQLGKGEIDGMGCGEADSFRVWL